MPKEHRPPIVQQDADRDGREQRCSQQDDNGAHNDVEDSLGSAAAEVRLGQLLDILGDVPKIDIVDIADPGFSPIPTNARLLIRHPGRPNHACARLDGITVSKPDRTNNICVAGELSASSRPDAVSDLLDPVDDTRRIRPSRHQLTDQGSFLFGIAFGKAPARTTPMI